MTAVENQVRLMLMSNFERMTSYLSEIFTAFPLSPI